MQDAPADRRFRTRGTETVARSAALERLRAIRGSGARTTAAVQVRMEGPIYDTVAEEDYAALVARRRKDSGNFIINDDGLGYVDDGREEDWTHRALRSSSDEESGGEDGAPHKRKQQRPPQAKRPPQQSAAAASLSAAVRYATGRRLRTRSTETVSHSAALERLRAVRGSGVRAAVQARKENPIYDTVAEEGYDVYDALVARCRKEAGAFIIDDDGREEDWTHRALPSSSDKQSGGEDGSPPPRP